MYSQSGNIRNGLMIAFVIIITACGKNPENKHPGREELEMAIEAIEQRHRLEMRIIKEHERQIEVMSANIEKSHSESMKDEYRNKILVRKAGIVKARHNIQNQDSVLKKLHLKLDSLDALQKKQVQ